MGSSAAGSRWQRPQGPRAGDGHGQPGGGEAAALCGTQEPLPDGLWVLGLLRAYWPMPACECLDPPRHVKEPGKGWDLAAQVVMAQPHIHPPQQNQPARLFPTSSEGPPRELCSLLCRDTDTHSMKFCKYGSRFHDPGGREAPDAP